MKKFTYVWCYTLLLLSVAAYAQPVDCESKAKLNVTEQTICHYPKLLAMDQYLNAIYQQALLALAQPDTLKQDQVVWLRNNRDLCANDRKCLAHTYQQRLKFLATVMAKPKDPLPIYYPVRWDHSIDLPITKPPANYPKFNNADHASNLTNFGLNSKNPCVKMFLHRSSPAFYSDVASYQFTSNTLNELPPNIGMDPNLPANQLVNGFLAGDSLKVMDPTSKIIYLSPYELIFTHTVNPFPTSNTGIEAVKLKIIAWGHFENQYYAPREDILLYMNENTQLTKTQWGGWGRQGGDALYIIATKKAGETRLRTKGFYAPYKSQCLLKPWDPVDPPKVINQRSSADLFFIPTFDLPFPK